MTRVERLDRPQPPRAGEAEAPPHLRLDPAFLVLPGKAEAVIAATLSPWGRRDELYLVADIYVAAHMRHPDGHLGWWSFAFGAGPTLSLHLRGDEERIEIADLEGCALDRWINDAVSVPPDATLMLQMVVRQRYNDSIVHLQPVPLYRDAARAAQADARRLAVGAPARDWVPPPSFQWPAGSTVRIITPTLPPLSRAARAGAALQLAGTLSREAIAWRLYAGSFDPELRGPVAPIGDLAEDAADRDVLLILFDDHLPELGWICRLPGCKVFAFLGLPDPDRLQVFDAEAYAHQLQARQDVAVAASCTLWAAPSDGLASQLGRLLLGPETDPHDTGPPDLLALADGEQRPDAATLAGLRRAIAAGRLSPGRVDIVRRRLIENHVLRCPLPERRTLWEEVEEPAGESLQRTGRPLLLAPGRLRPSDGIIPLLTLFSAFLEIEPEAALVITGDRPAPAFFHYLEHMLASRFATGAGRITLLADPDDAVLKRLYRECAAVIDLGSAPDRVLEEAVAFAKPLILLGQRAAAAPAERAGYRLHGRDPDAQAAAIATLLRQPARIDSLLAEQQRALAARRSPVGAVSLWELLETAVMQVADV